MDELIKELKNNQKINFEKGLKNTVNINYIIERLKDIKKEEKENYTIEKLAEILEEKENFTITEALLQTNKTPFDLLCIINYILADILDLTRYELETEQDKKDYDELIKIKDKILEIKNRNFDKNNE